MQLFLEATICNNDHDAANALDNICRRNKPICLERSFPMVLASIDCLFLDRILLKILALTDRPTLFLGLKMTRTQLICDPRLQRAKNL